MKYMQAAVLLIVGALAATVYTKWNRPAEPEAIPAAQIAEPAAAPATPTPAEVATPAPPPPAAAEPALKSKPSSKAKARKPEAVASAAPKAFDQPTISPPQAPAPEPEPVKAEQAEPPAPPAPPPARQISLKAGTILPVRLIETVSSDRNHPGDTFTASLDDELVIDGLVIAERGAKLEGKIVEAEQAGRVKGVSSISLQLTQITTSDGQRIAIESDAFTRAGPESRGQDAAKVGGAAAIGAAIGAIAGGGKGAAIGAGVGGAAGAGGVMTTRGKPAVLSSETKINFRLKNSVTVTEKRH